MSWINGKLTKKYTQKGLKFIRSMFLFLSDNEFNKYFNIIMWYNKKANSITTNERIKFLKNSKNNFKVIQEELNS